MVIYQIWSNGKTAFLFEDPTPEDQQNYKESGFTLEAEEAFKPGNATGPALWFKNWISDRSASTGKVERTNYFVN